MRFLKFAIISYLILIPVVLFVPITWTSSVASCKSCCEEEYKESIKETNNPAVLMLVNTNYNMCKSSCDMDIQCDKQGQ